MLFTFLLIVHAIIAAALVAVILVQKSEGGGLTSSGSPSGLMSARGAADFLTRLTAILATVFVAMSVLLAVLAATGGRQKVDATQAGSPLPSQGMSLGSQPQAPADTRFGAGTANLAAPANLTAPANAAAGNSSVPLAR